jgi:hypothetical protein
MEERQLSEERAMYIGMGAVALIVLVVLLIVLL